MCPDSHRFSYDGGSRCCASECDGSSCLRTDQQNDGKDGNKLRWTKDISWESRTCKDNDSVPCPNGKCEDSELALV